MKIEDIAKVCHEVIRSYCMAIGDDSQLPWDETPDWQQQTSVNGVKFHLGNNKSPEEVHQSWLGEKAKEGWVFGEVEDVDAKIHPYMVPYSELPVEQKIKDYLFTSIVNVIDSIPPDVDRIEASPAVRIINTDNSGKIAVRYIGPRSFYTDGAYGTGIVWDRGESKMVPIEKAVLMLKHGDVYEPGDPESAGAQKIKDVDKEKEIDEEEDNIRDSIRNMTRKAILAEFAKVHFNVDLEVSPTVKISELQADCIRLVDQFGMPG